MTTQRPMTDSEAFPLIDSPLSQTLSRNGVQVKVCIYRVGDTPWTLELVNAQGTSFVWDDTFANDYEAFGEAMRSLDEEPQEYSVDTEGQPQAASGRQLKG